jgi:Phosphoribosylanthranilate isomerase
MRGKHDAMHVALRQRIQDGVSSCVHFSGIMHVKICGIRRAEDALLAAEAGADAVGFLVGQRYNSPDFVTPSLAAEMARDLPSSVEAVLVTHVAEVEEIEQLVRDSGLTTIQLHGEINPASIAILRSRIPNLKVFKSVHVVSGESAQYPDRFREVVDGFVLDSINTATGQIGGTGLVHDWSLSRDIVTRYPNVPFLLAGGLNPANVRCAIKAVRPFGVDVNSGTKSADGFKDPPKTREFIREAKRVAS